MTDPDEQLPYRVEPKDGGFAVVDDAGRTVIASRTAANADQYAALLNHAYCRGYKAGFRAARPGNRPG